MQLFQRQCFATGPYAGAEFSYVSDSRYKTSFSKMMQQGSIASSSSSCLLKSSLMDYTSPDKSARWTTTNQNPFFGLFRSPPSICGMWTVSSMLAAAQSDASHLVLWDWRLSWMKSALTFWWLQEIGALDGQSLLGEGDIRRTGWHHKVNSCCASWYFVVIGHLREPETPGCSSDELWGHRFGLPLKAVIDGLGNRLIESCFNDLV